MESGESGTTKINLQKRQLQQNLRIEQFHLGAKRRNLFDADESNIGSPVAQNINSNLLSTPHK